MTNEPPYKYSKRLDIPTRNLGWRKLYDGKTPQARREKLLSLFSSMYTYEERSASSFRTLVDIGLWQDIITADGKILDPEKLQIETEKIEKALAKFLYWGQVDSDIKYNFIHLSLEAGINPNATYEYLSGEAKASLLMFQVVMNHKKAVELLIDAGADVNFIDTGGASIFVRFVQKFKRSDMTDDDLRFIGDTLIANGAHINGSHSTDGDFTSTAWLSISNTNNLEMASWLIDKGVDFSLKMPSLSDSTGVYCINSKANLTRFSTIPHVIGNDLFDEQTEKFLKKLAAHGVSLDEVNEKNQTPLLLAIQTITSDTIKARFLLDQGARVDIRADEYTATNGIRTGQTILESLTEFHLVSKDTLEIANLIFQKHPNCWNELTIQGEPLFSSLKEMNEDWYYVAQDHMLEHNTAPATNKKKQLRL